MPIRPATLADIAHVLPMVRAICDLHASRDPERFAVRADVIERYAKWFPERIADARSLFLVAEWPAHASRGVDDNAQIASAGASPPVLAGFTVCTIEPEVPIFWVPECGWVHDLYVVPEARRHGLARELLREVTRRYSAMGVKQLRLHTAMFNDAARAAFAAEGFRPCVVEMLKMLGPEDRGGGDRGTPH